MALANLLERLGLALNEAVFTLDARSNSVNLPNEVWVRLELIKPDAFYVFNNQPLILFFDLENEADNLREARIHKQIWSFDSAPLAFVIKPNEIEVFNAFSYDKETNRLGKIQISQNKIFQEFSFWKLESGSSWKWLQSNAYKNSSLNKRVNQKLFENIKAVREALTHPNTPNRLRNDDANILILRLIFIRYLIDREVSIDENFISGDDILQKRKSFSELVRTPDRLNNLFTHLNDRFNGVLFKDCEVILSPYQADSLSFVLEGSKAFGERTLFDHVEFYFDVFDFSIIPVEVISGIYESLLDEKRKDETSAVYTPSFLVEYILGETVDRFHQTYNVSECKIFDPALGSGIFLVQSLRRMIDQEIQLNGRENNALFSERIREIASKNLFGIDVNEQALKVACFSVYVALLDYQSPKDINQYEFPQLLDTNFFEANFFDLVHGYNHIIKSVDIDFILGNAPWKSDKDDLHLGWIKEQGQKVGRYEIAQSYLLRAKDFMALKSQCALVVTSTIFFNVSNKTRAFKESFLGSFRLETFLDLSPVRRLVFEGEKLQRLPNGRIKSEKYSTPAAVVIYRLPKPGEGMKNVVKHYSLKLNIFLKHFRLIVIEKHDRKEIVQSHFLKYPWMFKVALYGNTLDFAFMVRLHNKTADRKIASLFDDVNFFAGAGIKRGKNPTPFPELKDLPIIDNRAIQEYYTKVNHKKILKEEETYLERGRKPELFLGQKILLKEQAKDETRPVISFVTESAVYRNGVFAISSSDTKKLQCLYGYMISNLYTYYLFMTSCAWGIATRPALRFWDELLSFPYLAMSNDDQANFCGIVERFLNTFHVHNTNDLVLGEIQIDWGAFNEINQRVFELYGLGKVEKDLVDFTLEVSRYQFQESKYEKVIRFKDRNSDLKQYAKVFASEFADLYEGEYLWIEVFSLEYFTAMNFRFDKQKPSQDEEIVFMTRMSDMHEVLSFLSKNLTIHSITGSKNLRDNVYIQKDIKGFETNSFYIIKPNEFKCWHRAMAWYDVAEFRESIEQAEKAYLRNSNI